MKTMKTMTIVKIYDHIEKKVTSVCDENGNIATLGYWGSIEAAHESLFTLIDCKNCIDCYCCDRCIKCYRCELCLNLVDCRNAIKETAEYIPEIPEGGFLWRGQVIVP